MAIAQGINKKVVIKKESQWGVPAGKDGGQYMRRVTSDFDLKKDVYTSNENRDDQQVAVSRHGLRKAEGTLVGELSAGSYFMLMESLLRGTAVAGATFTGTVSLTAEGFVGAGFAAAGFRAGQVVRATGFANADSNANNFIVAEASDTLLKGQFVNGADIVPEADVVDVTIAVPGAVVNVPTTGHTDTSFTLEHYFSDLELSELYTGLKVGGMEVSLPATGMATVSFPMTGKNSADAAEAYFTNPAEATTTNAMAAASGVVFVAGKRMTLATSMSVNVTANLSTEAVIGSNEVPDVFRGTLGASGQLTVFFENNDQRRAFLDEQDLSVFAVLTESAAPDADFLVIHLPRISLNGASKDDGAKGLVQTVPFTALKKAGFTTIEIQDSTITV